MTELVGEFSALPEGHQAVLRLAQERHGIEITPLQELVGGRTGAYLYLVSVSSPDSIQHLVLKLDKSRPAGKFDEMDKHGFAVEQAPPQFAHEHMAQLAFDKVQTDESLAIFYTIAGGSLHRYRTLASHASQRDLQAIFQQATHGLLAEWNAGMTFQQAVHPHDLLTRWVGSRTAEGGAIEQFLSEVCGVHPEIGGLIIGGEVYPNPLIFARSIERWGSVRAIDAALGFLHGDMNVTNLLVKFSPDEQVLEDYYLIDFAMYQSDVPLLYDSVYLETSYLLDYVPRVTLTSWISLVRTLAREDIPDPQLVPVELAGAGAVIRAGRETFDAWVQTQHPTLSDDLWGQFWLAGVAAGLNFCNKQTLSDEERIASLVYAAAHLKRYAVQFGIPLPAEAADINAPHRAGDALRVYPTTESVSAHLPIPRTSYIDHDDLVATAQKHLMREDVSLLTLTGPGGVGKTRLSLEIAQQVLDDFEDGVFFIDLAPVTDRDLVITTIAQTLGVRDAGGRPVLERMQDYLKDRRILLLLDNFEQVVDGGPVVAELMSASQALKVLVTSRIPLNVRGEHELRVSPLNLPDPDQIPEPESLNQYEAVRLFINRAQAVKAGFTVTNENAPAVAEICYRLDGLPLAIELAAARIKLLSPDKILSRLDHRLNLLTGGARDLPERQQTLRGAIDWSYDLLDEGEKRLFALLAVFPNCSFEAVEEVVNGIDFAEPVTIDVLDGLSSLVDKSLLRLSERGSAEPRLLMLETILEYASERLAEDEAFKQAVEHAHAAYFADFARRQWKRQAEGELEIVLREVEAEHENIRVAWRYWVAADDYGQLRDITDCLWMLYDTRGWYHATVGLTEDLLKVLAATPSTPERAEQEITLQTSYARALMYSKGYIPEVLEAYTRALELCQTYGVPQEFPVLRALASFYNYTGDSVKGAEMGAQILALGERLGDTRMQVTGHTVLGNNLAFQNQVDEGLAHLEQAIALYEPDRSGGQRFRLGNDPGVVCHTTSAIFYWQIGRPDFALERSNQAVALAYQLNHPFSMAYSLFHTGIVHFWRGELEQAQSRAQAVLDLASKHEFPVWRAVAHCLHGASMTAMGWAEEGPEEVNRGMELYRGLNSPPVFWPLLLYLQAGTYAMAARPGEALEVIEGAIEFLGPMYENQMSSIFYRLRGDLLVMTSPENIVDAERDYQRALDQSTLKASNMFHLQAATSMARLWQSQGRVEDARQLLVQALEPIEEGFTTLDVRAAQALLDQLP